MNSYCSNEYIRLWLQNELIYLILNRFSNHETLIPDAPELIANFLEGEQDASCKRNAFMMLIHADQVTILISAMLFVFYH